MTYTIDLSLLTDSETAHTLLRSLLPLPEWYGENLDALYDCLTELSDVCLTLLHSDSAEGYAVPLLSVITDAAQENPSLTLVFADPSAES